MDDVMTQLTPPASLLYLFLTSRFVGLSPTNPWVKAVGMGWTIVEIVGMYVLLTNTGMWTQITVAVGLFLLHYILIVNNKALVRWIMNFNQVNIGIVAVAYGIAAMVIQQVPIAFMLPVVVHLFADADIILSPESVKPRASMLNLNVMHAFDSPAYREHAAVRALYEKHINTYENAEREEADDGLIPDGATIIQHINSVNDLADFQERVLNKELKSDVIAIVDDKFVELAHGLTGMNKKRVVLLPLTYITHDTAGLYSYDDVLKRKDVQVLASVKNFIKTGAAQIWVVTRQPVPFIASDTLAPLITFLANFGDGWARYSLTDLLGSARATAEAA
jgi:hypothetical protein